MPGPTKSYRELKEKDEGEAELELIDKTGIFYEMYIKDPEVQKRILEILESPALKKLMKKAKKRGKSIDLLNEIVPEEPDPGSLFKMIRRRFRIFKIEPNYDSKSAYLAYLKSSYRFLMVPMEEPPGPMFRLFYPQSSSTWTPSRDNARVLLENFFVESQLVRRISDKDWERVKNSKDPEVVLNRLLYGIKFKPEFEEFLMRIPWILSRDMYGAPALDLMYWRAPGPELPQKPVAVDDKFIDRLVESVQQEETYAKIEIGDEFVELENREQIMERLEEDERVLIDTFVGISKIEFDYVLRKRLILWQNPGYEQYQKESALGKIKKQKPLPDVIIFQERAEPLEIPFITSEPIESEEEDREAEQKPAEAEKKEESLEKEQATE